MSSNRYNIFSAEYKDMDSVQTSTNFEYLNKNWEKVVLKKKILEVGCGAGKVVAYLAQHLPRAQVDARDISSSLIELNVEKYRDLENLSFRVQNMVEMNDISSFDLIVSFFCFHWIPLEQQLDTLKKMLAALKAGGDLLMIIPIESISLLKARQEAVASHKWNPLFKGYSPKGIIDNSSHYDSLFNKLRDPSLGFTFTYRSEYYTKQIAMSFEEFNHFYTGWAPEINGNHFSSKNDVTLFVKDVFERMPKDIEGRILFDYNIYYNQASQPLLPKLWVKSSLDKHLHQDHIIPEKKPSTNGYTQRCRL
jgi:ubiquinone/menaquinone biosynthesis C-methylase UbiE